MAKREKLVFGDSGLSVEEHVASQRAFLEGELEPLLANARSGRGRMYFVDAAHFVRSSYLCCVWCLVRSFIRAVDECLDGLETVHKEEIGTLMTQNFQTFDETSFLAA